MTADGLIDMPCCLLGLTYEAGKSTFNVIE